ncbi:MAG: heavy metal translocating P-type ATPase, partial [Spirochaetales bacterium]
MQEKECEVCSALPTQRRELIIIGISFFSGLGGILIWEIPKQRSMELSLVGGSLLALAFLLAGADIFQKAFRNLIRGNMLDELSLMSIASFGALFIGAMEEAVGVLVLYRLGEYLQEYAVQKSRYSIRSLLSLRPDTARVLRENQWKEVHPADIKPGEILLCRAGERLPVDGEVVEGAGAFDTSALTGESLPRSVETGSEALAGFIVQNGVIKIRALRPASESAVNRILSLVEKALEAKAKPELFIHRFAKGYTPTVVALAFSIAFFPPL